MSEPGRIVTVDARGHRCPVPTLKLRKALADAKPGELVNLLADDPMARIDTPLFLREAGHELVEAGEEGSTVSFLVRKGALAAPGD